MSSVGCGVHIVHVIEVKFVFGSSSWRALHVCVRCVMCNCYCNHKCQFDILGTHLAGMDLCAYAYARNWATGRSNGRSRPAALHLRSSKPYSMYSWEPTYSMAVEYAYVLGYACLRYSTCEYTFRRNYSCMHMWCQIPIDYGTKE